MPAFATLSLHFLLWPSHVSATSHGLCSSLGRQTCAQHAAHLSMGLSKRQRDPAAAQLTLASSGVRAASYVSQMALQACEVTGYQ